MYLPASRIDDHESILVKELLGRTTKKKEKKKKKKEREQ